jgi:hypothetical protein
MDAGSLVIKTLADFGVRVPDVASTVTVPEEEPVYIMAEATPEVLVVRGTVITELGIGLKLARVVPAVIVSVTGWLYAGAPVPVRSVTLTVA